MDDTNKNNTSLSQNTLFQGQDVQQSAWVGTTFNPDTAVANKMTLCRILLLIWNTNIEIKW